MNEPGLNYTEPTVNFCDNASVDDLAAYLLHKDRRVRQQAVVALGNTGDCRAVEPLIVALSREVSRGASSFPVIIDMIDALAKIPDHRALDVLVKLEGQIIDRDSPRCPAELPAGVITYIDTVDGQLHHVVPRELHFKLLDVMRRTSAQLMYRNEEIAARYTAYQDEIIRAEIDGTIPRLTQAIQEESLATPAPEIHDDITPEVPPPSADVMEGINYDVIRREMEIEVSEYVRDNEKLQALIREGQRIKAHIQHAKLEKLKYSAVLHTDKASVR